MSVEYKVDFTPVIADIRRVLSTASEEIQRRATYNALNHVGDIALTKVRKHLRDQTSAKYGAVMKYVTNTKRAHPNNLTYKIGAKGPAMPLKAFAIRGKPGGQFSVTVWGHTRRYKNTFLIGPPKDNKKRKGFAGNLSEIVPVKRVSKGHKAGSLKALWGPIIPKEMLRGGFQTRAYLENQLPYDFVKRLEHDIAQAMIRAAARG